MRTDAEDLRRQVERATFHYIGVNHALRSLEVPQRIARQMFGVEATLRLTVHAKPGEPRPMLTPSNRLARPGLLPMHSVGVMARDGQDTRLGSVFELEALMAGHRARMAGERFVAFEIDEVAASIEVAARAA